MKPAREMSDDALTAEIDNLYRQWGSTDREGSGSRGEWMVERMDEIGTEQRRRMQERLTFKD